MGDSRVIRFPEEQTDRESERSGTELDRIVRFPPDETSERRDSWIERVEKDIDTELDNLLRYGDIYLYEVAERENYPLA